MRITYTQAIQESEEELTELEQRLRGRKTADRVRMLRLLKSGTVKNLKDCALLVGYSVIQLTRWWECYRAESLTVLLKQHKPVGKASQLAPEAWEGLLQAMRRDTSRPCKTRAITWSASGGFATRTASRCGGCSRNTG
jgi:hypothetical protein